MAGLDYKHCGVCKGRVFYSASLDLEALGAWFVLCLECSKTYELQVVRRKSKRVKLRA